ncbi:hypothetical protein [Roseateles sp.]
MSKTQRGNKEAKKPKQAAVTPHKDLLPSAMALTPPSPGACKQGSTTPKK